MSLYFGFPITPHVSISRSVFRTFRLPPHAMTVFFCLYHSIILLRFANINLFRLSNLLAPTLRLHHLHFPLEQMIHFIIKHRKYFPIYLWLLLFFVVRHVSFHPACHFVYTFCLVIYFCVTSKRKTSISHWHLKVTLYAFHFIGTVTKRLSVKDLSLCLSTKTDKTSNLKW